MQTLRGIDALVVAAQCKSQLTKKRRSALFSNQSTGRFESDLTANNLG
jgi:hypothetical protein